KTLIPGTLFTTRKKTHNTGNEKGKLDYFGLEALIKSSYSDSILLNYSACGSGLIKLAKKWKSPAETGQYGPQTAICHRKARVQGFAISSRYCQFPLSTLHCICLPEALLPGTKTSTPRLPRECDKTRREVRIVWEPTASEHCTEDNFDREIHPKKKTINVRRASFSGGRNRKITTDQRVKNTRAGKSKRVTEPQYSVWVDFCRVQ
ncbi:hypothetical protein J6590_059500, partial [Homalodisca vitripennis]